MVLELGEEDNIFPIRQGEEGQGVEYIGGDLRPAGMEFIWNGFIESLDVGDFNSSWSPLIGTMNKILVTDGSNIDSAGTVYFKMPFETRLKQFKVFVGRNGENSAIDLVIVGISSYTLGEAVGVIGNEYARITIPALTAGEFSVTNNDSSLTIAKGEAVILIQETSGSTITNVTNLSTSLRFKEVVA